jgi:ribosomal protein S18 acetylase RimI-like enzyme
VARARWAKDVAPGAVRTIASDLSARRAPWRWYVGSAVRSDDLIRLLRAAGLMSAPARTPMLLELSDRVLTRLVRQVQPVPDLLVTVVRDRPAMAAWVAARTAATGWSERTALAWLSMHLGLGLDEDEPLQHLVGSIGHEPVASISVFVDSDGTAGIHHLDVIPDARGLGIASFLSVAAVGLAADHGADRVVVAATPAALGLYRRLDFTAQGSFTYFIDPVLGP